MTTYPKSPKVLKGALIELTEPFLGPVPNIIPFQYNPETSTRTLTPWEPPGDDESGANSLSQPYDPEETIDLTLELDASDDLEQPDQNPVAVVSGVADRLAALEKLVFPASTSFGLGGLVDAAASLFGAADAVPRRQAPVTLFVWGPGRIVPVRLTTFRISEQAYSPTLYPIRATVTLKMQVLTDRDFTGDSLAEDIARTSYRYTKTQKELLARAGQLSNLDSILGILPF
ncbi:MAG: hypothetical protein ACOC5K_00560 [Chloroflexota bacterium]